MNDYCDACGDTLCLCEDRSPTPDGITLTEGELRALARRLIAREAAEFDMWLDWGDQAPELAESSWLALVDAVEAEAKELGKRASDADRAEGIDSMFLLGRVS